MSNYVVVGAITGDLEPDGSLRPGGAAWYVGRALGTWGAQPLVIAPCAWARPTLAPLARLVRAPSVGTTIFENRYVGDARSQRIRGLATPLDWAALAPLVAGAAVLHLAPVADEVDFPPATLAPKARRYVTPQGWLRTWGADGAVEPRSWEPSVLQLRSLDGIVVSEEDLGYDDTAALGWASHGPLVAITRGSAGATVVHNGTQTHVPAFVARPRDLTGAGDIWSAAWFWQLGRGLEPVAAARWANAAAACAIERSGAELPDSASVEARMLGTDRR